MKDQPILSIEGLSMMFPGTLALDKVDLDVFEGEIMALVGENGAGKSTMMKVLSGTYPFGTYEGVVRIREEEQRFSSVRDAEKAGVAMIHQEITIAKDLSVAENILMGILPVNKLFIDRRGMIRKAEEILDFLCMSFDVTQPVRNLPPSYQQIVCIARALIRKPKILVLDEPTSPLTENETDDLMHAIRCLKDKKISCIYISHKLEEVFGIADRIVVLRDGRRISEYKRASFDSKKIVEDIIGRELDVLFPEKTNKPGREVFRVENLSINDPGVPGKKIINNVSFVLRKGEVLGLAGLVGSGRSELLKGLFGAIPVEAGRFYMNGEMLKIAKPATAISLGIGLLTEDRKTDGYIPTYSVLHNITISILKKISRFSFLNFNNERKAGGNFYRKLRIKAPSITANINQLSGGNQQKALLAKWLLTDPQILLLDEPTRGVDVGTKAEIYKIINEMSEKGVSIIMISSELQEIIALCDRILVLNGGIVKQEFNGKEAEEGKILHAAAFSE